MARPLDASDPARPLTTGQVSKILRVSPRTVALWVEAGKLDGFRLPDRKGTGFGGDRRIYPDSVARLCRELNMRIPKELAEPVPLAFGLSAPPARAARADAFGLSDLIRGRVVSVALIGDADGLPAARRAAELVRAADARARIVLVLDPAQPDAGADWPAGLIDRRAVLPCDLDALLTECGA